MTESWQRRANQEGYHEKIGNSNLDDNHHNISVLGNCIDCVNARLVIRRTGKHWVHEDLVTKTSGLSEDIMKTAIVYNALVFFAACAHTDASLIDYATWDRLPITPVIEPGSDPKLIRAVGEAASWWNESSGLHLFDPPAEYGVNGIYVLVVMVESSDEDHHVATTGRSYIGHTFQSAVVRVYSPALNLNTAELKRAIAHEFGHIFGLGHDEIRESVMFPYVIDTEPELTEQDRWLILQLYKDLARSE